jgi:hypothetical protein
MECRRQTADRGMGSRSGQTADGTQRRRDETRHKATPHRARLCGRKVAGCVAVGDPGDSAGGAEGGRSAAGSLAQPAQGRRCALSPGQHSALALARPRRDLRRGAGESRPPDGRGAPSPDRGCHSPYPGDHQTGRDAVTGRGGADRRSSPARGAEPARRPASAPVPAIVTRAGPVDRPALRRRFCAGDPPARRLRRAPLAGGFARPEPGTAELWGGYSRDQHPAPPPRSAQRGWMATAHAGSHAHARALRCAR